MPSFAGNAAPKLRYSQLLPPSGQRRRGFWFHSSEWDCLHRQPWSQMWNNENLLYICFFFFQQNKECYNPRSKGQTSRNRLLGDTHWEEPPKHGYDSLFAKHPSEWEMVAFIAPRSLWVNVFWLSNKVIHRGSNRHWWLYREEFKITQLKTAPISTSDSRRSQFLLVVLQEVWRKTMNLSH